MTPSSPAATMLSIRTARVTDARAVDLFLSEVFESARHVITRPSEFQPGFLSRRIWIARKQLNPVELCLLAIADGRIVGLLECWTDRRARVAHITCFFMAIAQPYQRRGIGRRLLAAFTNWVAAHDTLEKIELHVHDDNHGAIKLYESMGFVVEGRRAGAVRYEDGRIIDDILMARWPDKTGAKTPL